MTIQARVSALKQHLEQLFPGKWRSGKEKSKTLLTGLSEIDLNLSRGLVRQRITECIGSISSGKTTILRAIIANWCTSGFNVIYIDQECRLLAADWALVDQGRGRFWVVRPNPVLNQSESNQSKSAGITNSSLDMLVGSAREPPQVLTYPALHRITNEYAANQFIRSNTFDVVIWDLGNTKSLSSRTYARLQNSLSHSHSALLILQDNPVENFDHPNTSDNWGYHTKLTFRWAEKINYEAGLNGITAIVPSINLSIWQNGLAKSVEVNVGSHVSNRLFTHQPVPDRRTSEA